MSSDKRDTPDSQQIVRKTNAPPARLAPQVPAEQEERRPERPQLRSKNNAPVIVKVSAPLSVRLAQLLWILSFLAGAAAIVYLSIIREDQIPLIAEMAENVDSSRPEGTYERAADIVYWSAFAFMVMILLMQLTALVSFTNRKPNIRWWQFTEWLIQVPVYLLIIRMVALEEKGELLTQLLLLQLILVILALLAGVLPKALAWSYRRQDVRRVEDTEGLTNPEKP